MNLKIIKHQTRYNHQAKTMLANHRQQHRKRYHLHRHCIRLPLRRNLKRKRKSENENFVETFCNFILLIKDKKKFFVTLRSILQINYSTFFFCCTVVSSGNISIDQGIDKSRIIFFILSMLIISKIKIPFL